MAPDAPGTKFHGTATPFTLSAQQRAYFRTFGFLRIPGLFRNEIADITNGFEEVFEKEQPHILDPTNEFHHATDAKYRNQPRSIIPSIVDKSDKLAWLRGDERIRTLARTLLGERFEYAESDGNLFNCDVYWHLDAYGAPVDIKHIKIYFYLDRLTAETGSLRLIPGSNHPEGGFTTRLRGSLLQPRKVEEIYGIPLDQIPSWSLENEPGDVVVGDFRTLHASFGGAPRRRMFTLNFREGPASDGDA